MSAPFKDATNDAVQFLTKHGDLTRAAAYDAIRLLTGNGFVVTQTDMLPAEPAQTVQEAARVLLGVFEDPDANAPHGFDWQAMYDEMTADHKESMDICGAHDWPSTLIVALRAIAGGGDE